VGLVQAVREVPGLMGFVLGLLALYLSEVRIMALSIVLLGAGTILTAAAGGLPMLLVSTALMSLGFHFFYPSNNAVVLMVVSKQETPEMLGRLGSLGSIAAVAGTALVYFLARPWGYQALFIAVGVTVVAGGLLLLPFRGGQEGLPPKRKVVLRRRYWLYYTLSFLLGSRRHIFTTFAIYLLVREHGINVQTTALLFLVNSLINVYTLRLCGRLVARFGERLTMSVSFAVLAFVFLGYAYVTSLPVLFALFVLDNVLFGTNLGLTTYFQKIAVTPEEMTSNVSLEQTINHIAAIIVPIVGGTVWELLGAQAPFLVGTTLVIASLVLVQFLRTTPEPSAVPA
jgi:predicted MFS family arabinose efflux permease